MVSAIVTYIVAFLGGLKKRSKGVTFLLITICFIMAWLSNDGYDYINYEFAYNNPQSVMAKRFELGYQLVMQLGRIAKINYVEFRAVYSAVALLIIVSALKYYTEDINFPLALGLVFPLLYLFPIQRFFMAAAIILFCSRYLIDKTWSGVLKFLAGVVIAGLFHSGCFFFLLFPLYHLAKSKKNFFLITIGLLIPFIVLAEMGAIGKIITFLPLGSSTIYRIESGNRANLNGILEECVLVLLVIVPGLLAVYYYFKSSEEKRNHRMDSFMNLMFYVNVMTLFIIAIRVYSKTSERMLYVTMMMNYTATAITLNIHRTGDIRHCSIPTLVVTVASVSGIICFLVFEMFYCAPQLKDFVFWMHFNTNPIFEGLNSLFGV